MRVFRSGFYLSTANLLTAVISFGGITIFARLLDPASLGIYFLFEGIVMVTILVFDLGINEATEKRVSEDWGPDEVYTAGFITKGIIILVTSFLAISLRSQINEYLSSEFALWLIPAIAFAAFHRYHLSVLRGELKINESAVILFFRRVVWVSLGASLIFLNFEVFGLIVGFITSNMISTIVAWYYISSSISIPSRKHFASIIHYAKYGMIGNIGGSVYKWSDTLMIGYFLDSSAVGVYEIAWRLTIIVMAVSNAVSKSLFPQVSNWHTAGDTERISAVFPTALFFSLVFVIPAVLGMSILSDSIIREFFGPNYLGASIIVIILMFDKVAEASHSVIVSVLRGINRPDLMARASIITIFINVIFNALFIIFFGIAGAAIATVIASTFNAILHARYLSMHMELHIPYNCIIWSLVSTFVMAGLIWIYKVIAVINTWPHLAAVISFGITIYSGVLLANPKIRNTIMQALQGTIDENPV